MGTWWCAILLVAACGNAAAVFHGCLRFYVLVSAAGAAAVRSIQKVILCSAKELPEELRSPSVLQSSLSSSHKPFCGKLKPEDASAEGAGVALKLAWECHLRR